MVALPGGVSWEGILQEARRGRAHRAQAAIGSRRAARSAVHARKHADQQREDDGKTGNHPGTASESTPGIPIPTSPPDWDAI